MKQSQNQKILNRLKKGYSINPIQALELFGCFRLAARINDLKNKGYAINSRKLTNKHGISYAEYTLEA